MNSCTTINNAFDSKRWKSIVEFIYTLMMAGRLRLVNLVLSLTVFFRSYPVIGFNCDLANRLEISINDEPPASKTMLEKIEVKDYVIGSMNVLFGSLPGSGAVIFVVDKFLSLDAAQENSPWDDVKDKVKKFVNMEIDRKSQDDICKRLQMFQERISLCTAYFSTAKTECIFNLVNYMMGSEPIFKGTRPRDKALLVGPYTIYTVMTLAVGKMFLQQNRTTPYAGATVITNLKKKAKDYSEYAKHCVSEAIKWRLNEIGHYIIENRHENVFRTWWTTGEQGILKQVTKRSTEDDVEDVAVNPDRDDDEPEVGSESGAEPDETEEEYRDNTKPKDESEKRYGVNGPIYRKQPYYAPKPYPYPIRIVVTDNLNGNQIYHKFTQRKVLAKGDTYEWLKDGAYTEKVKPEREAEEQKMKKIYDEKILRITNEYWRIYDKEDFSTVEAEAENGQWLKEQDSNAATRDLDENKPLKGTL